MPSPDICLSLQKASGPAFYHRFLCVSFVVFLALILISRFSITADTSISQSSTRVWCLEEDQQNATDVLMAATAPAAANAVIAINTLWHCSFCCPAVTVGTVVAVECPRSLSPGVVRSSACNCFLMSKSLTCDIWWSDPFTRTASQRIAEIVTNRHL